MEFANRVPFCLSGYAAFDIPWVVPVSCLTSLAITSHRSHNLQKLMPLKVYAAGTGMWNVC
jgi:hypothetical protein